MVNLFTTFYKEKDETRYLELQDCIRLNDACSAIDRIYVWLEKMDELPFNSDKIVIIPAIRRPTYNDFFKEINKVTNSEDVNIIANTDIFFKEDFEIIKNIDLNNKCFALTRWDIKEDSIIEFFGRVDSQDTWIFKGKIKEITGDFHLGSLGCDNKIAYEIKKVGYELLNPSLTFKSYHLHLSHHRVGLSAYTAKPLPGPYLYIPITTHKTSAWPNLFSGKCAVNKKNNDFLMHRLYSSWLQDMMINKEKKFFKISILLLKCFYYRPATDKKYMNYFFKKLAKPVIKLYLS